MNTTVQIPWWNKRSTKIVLASLSSAGTIGVGVAAAFLSSTTKAFWWLILAAGVTFVASFWLILADAKDQTLEGEIADLRKKLTKAEAEVLAQSRQSRSDGYQSAASRLKELLEMIHAHLARWSPELSTDVLQRDAVKLARDFLDELGIEGVRVSLYSPSAVEREGSEDGENDDEIRALSLVCTASVPGRHKPKSFHVKDKDTAHMFVAMSSSSPSSPPSLPSAVSWKAARQVGVGINNPTLQGLLTADSTSDAPFPAQADDILILAVEFLILIDRTSKELLGDSGS